jgi:hypothetical protein
MERASVDRVTKESTLEYPFFANDNYQDYLITRELLVDVPYRAARGFAVVEWEAFDAKLRSTVAPDGTTLLLYLQEACISLLRVDEYGQRQEV